MSRKKYGEDGVQMELMGSMLAREICCFWCMSFFVVVGGGGGGGSGVVVAVTAVVVLIITRLTDCGLLLGFGPCSLAS